MHSILFNFENLLASRMQIRLFSNDNIRHGDQGLSITWNWIRCSNSLLKSRADLKKALDLLSGIYILKKIRNFTKTKIQNCETLPKLNISIYSKFGQHYRHDITMYDFIHFIQFLIPIWSWISKMMLENVTFFHLFHLFFWILKNLEKFGKMFAKLYHFQYKIRNYANCLVWA